MNRCSFRAVTTRSYRDLENSWANKRDWNLLDLQVMYKAGNSIEDIIKVVPFRDDQCTRASRCCGMCTRQCSTRCIQDSLYRLHIWRQMVQYTKKEDFNNIPLGIRLIVNQEFESVDHLSWCVGEIISRKTNVALNEYMTERNITYEDHPYQIDYAPRPVLNPKTGKPMVNTNNGLVKLYDWPETGLCPFCIPYGIIHRRYVLGTNARSSEDSIS